MGAESAVAATFGGKRWEGDPSALMVELESCMPLLPMHSILPSFLVGER